MFSAVQRYKVKSGRKFEDFENKPISLFLYIK